jgi:hypothetical protein
VYWPMWRWSFETRRRIKWWWGRYTDIKSMICQNTVCFNRKK